MEDYYVEELTNKQIIFKVIITLVVVACAILLGLYLLNKNTLHIKEELTFEAGSILPTKVSEYVTSKIISDSDFKIEVDGYNLGDKLTTVGEYKYSVKTNNCYKEGKIKVIDTTSPTVKIENLTVGVNEEYVLDDFIASCEDYSMPCTVTLKEDKDYTEKGEYELVLVISDKENNKVEKNAKLIIKENYSRKNEIAKDLKVASTDPEIDDFKEENAFVIFDKAYADEDKYAEEYLLDLLESTDLNKYIPAGHSGTIVDNQTIELLNKSGYVVGYAFKVTLSSGDVVYLKNN